MNIQSNNYHYQKTLFTFATALVGAGLFIVSAPPAHAANVYYVDKDSKGGACSDSNPGTITQPWCAIGKAKRSSGAVQPGDTVYVRGGTYYFSQNSVKFGYTGNDSGDLGNPIIYKSYPGESVIFDGQNNVTFFSISSCYGNSDNLVFDGFNFRNHVIAFAVRSSRNIIIKNMVMTDGGKANQGAGEINVGRISSPSCPHSENVIIENNLISNPGLTGTYHGLYLAGINITVRNNTIHGSSGAGILIQIHEDRYEDTKNMWIYGNELYNNSGGIGITRWEHSNYNGVTENINIFNNLIWGNVGGISIRGGTTNDIFVYHNTVLNNPEYGILLEDSGRYYLKNNIAFGNGDILSYGNGDFVLDNNINTSNIYFTNNVIVVYKSSHGNQDNYFNSILIPSNIITDPLFLSTDPSNSNFLKLSPTSPAINKGVNVGITNDYIGTSRPQGTGYDIGAYEYPSGGSGDITPPSAPTGVTVS